MKFAFAFPLSPRTLPFKLFGVNCQIIMFAFDEFISISALTLLLTKQYLFIPFDK